MTVYPVLEVRLETVKSFFEVLYRILGVNICVGYGISVMGKAGVLFIRRYSLAAGGKRLTSSSGGYLECRVRELEREAERREEEEGKRIRALQQKYSAMEVGFDPPLPSPLVSSLHISLPLLTSLTLSLPPSSLLPPPASL